MTTYTAIPNGDVDSDSPITTSLLQFHLLFILGDFSLVVAWEEVAEVDVDRRTVFGGGSSSGNTTTPEFIFKNAMQAMGYTRTSHHGYIQQ